MEKLINTFTYVPRIRKDDKKLELVFLDEHLDVQSWCAEEAHSNATRGWYACCTLPVPKEREAEAEKFFQWYLSLYPKPPLVKEKMGKRLTPPTYKLYCQSDADKAYYQQFKK